ncbi:MAG: flagellar biosynthesis protein FlgA [Proteobacteria bacterium]|nr:flagellar biosynthesis protein FlgA [Pseudomonadota bacterium]
MNLFAKLQAEAAAGRPVRAGLIGAGKFGSMFLAQAPTTPGLEVSAIADLAPERARAALTTVGWDAGRAARTAIITSGAELAARDDVDVVIEATGDPEAGILHARAAIAGGKHIVMVNVEADVLAGPLLAAEARAAGLVYSMAYGDQPALVAELVDWARACGFRVVAAGKGTRYQPRYHRLTPDEVWDHYGIGANEAGAAGMNSQMFTSFMDGTKSAIEAAAIANACDLKAPSKGLSFPPCGVDELAQVLRPASRGGMLEDSGMVEVIAAEQRDGRPVERDLRWGVYVVIEAPSDYAAACFKQYGLKTDDSGRFAALYRPCHLIGLELGISVLSAALRGEATGSARAFNGDVMAVAKRDLAAGETLDGEGGYCLWGKLAPAAAALARGALPIGLARGAVLLRSIKAGEVVTWQDVEIDPDRPAVLARREMEARFAPGEESVAR